MTTIITRQLSTVFSGSINERKLHDEINTNSNIITVCDSVGVEYETDTVNITFQSEPNAGELTELDNVVIPAHDNTRPKGSVLDNVGVGENGTPYLSCVETVYTEKKKFFYNSSKKLNNITLSLKVDAGTTGSVKVVTCPAGETVCERTDIIGTDEINYDMGTLSNLPKNGTQRFCIMMKVDVGTMYMSAVANDYD